MGTRRLSGWRRTVVAFSVLALAPAVASAQATLSGTVTDSSGAVLPGVTVEARSPVLIEQVRTGITDGTGTYAITALPPGTYSVTFQLVGFSTVVREGVQVQGIATITIDARLQVGGLEETITVTGETPVVDVQSSRRGSVLTDDLVKALPATRGYNAIVFMVPGMSAGGSNNQVDLMPAMRIFYSNGGRGNEGRVQVDGLNVGAAFNGGGVSGYTMDTVNAEELSFTLSGGLGEAETGGALLNIVPKTGGNTFAGTAFLSTAGEWSQGSNLDDELRAFGITNPNALIANWDASASLGGPIVRDRLWFLGSIRSFGQAQEVPNGFANANVGDPTRWDYTRNENQVIRGANDRLISTMRLTAQVHPKHKIGIYYDYQKDCSSGSIQIGADYCRSATEEWVPSGNATNAPEATAGTIGLGIGAAGRADSYARVIQGSWTAPLTNQLLLEAGWSTYFSRWGWMEAPGDVKLIQVQEQALGNYNYRGIERFFNDVNWNTNWRASAAFVTGSHNMKFGYQGGRDVRDDTNFRGGGPQLTYRFNFGGNGVAGIPNRITQWVGAWETKERTEHHAVYAQDQWTRDRLSLQGAVRFERAYSWFPEGQGWGSPLRFVPNPERLPRIEGVPGFNDIMFRGGLAYDLRGDGRTSLKFNIGQYVQSSNNQDRYVASNIARTLDDEANRSWSDDNGNYVPDCDLLDPQANGECGRADNLQWGTLQSATEVNPAILEGWGVRPADWQLGVGIQHEVAPRVSVEVTYNRRAFKNFTVTDNRAVGPGDYTAFTFVAPTDPRLGAFSGRTITGYDINPDKFGQVDNYETFETDYGPARTQYWHGFDVNVQARLQNGLIFQGGTNTGRGVQKACETLAAINSPDTYQLGCDYTEQWQTQFRGVISYIVPVIDVQLSTSMRFTPNFQGIGGNTSGTVGDDLSANYRVSNSEAVAGGLGRFFSGTSRATQTRTYNLTTPGEDAIYGPRIKNVDLRVAKILTFRGTRTQIGFDLYNLFNENTGLQFNETYGARWLQPTQIMFPRFVRFNVTVDF